MTSKEIQRIEELGQEMEQAFKEAVAERQSEIDELRKAKAELDGKIWAIQHDVLRAVLERFKAKYQSTE